MRALGAVSAIFAATAGFDAEQTAPLHFFAGVAAPAVDVSVAREDRAPKLTQLGFVQERFRRAVYVAAVIEHKAGFVRVTKKFKPRHLLTFAVTSGVQIIDNVVAVLKPN